MEAKTPEELESYGHFDDLNMVNLPVSCLKKIARCDGRSAKIVPRIRPWQRLTIFKREAQSWDPAAKLRDTKGEYTIVKLQK